MMQLFAHVMHLLWHFAHPDDLCIKEEEDDEGPTPTVISDVSLCRQMLYDAFEDPEAIAEMAGLPAVSAEVAEMEARAHVTRLQEMGPIMGLLLGQADFMGHAAALLHCSQGAEDADLDDVSSVFTNVIKGSIVASVSSAVALGIIEIRKQVTTSDV